MPKEIIHRARELGFIGVGFSYPKKPLYFDKFTSWISAGNNADMSWLMRYIEIRENPELLLQGCRTIISLAYPYSPEKPCSTDGLSVSRYSRPDQEDYHYRVREFCLDLVRMIEDTFRGTSSRVCIDSAPIMERSFAYSSGIGFIGKNNMLIIPGYGSYFYLAEILTTAAFDIKPVELMEDLCGNCTLCIDSCPTGALERPFYLNASKCLSYLTIEHKGNLTDTTGEKMGDCFFGCDRCQEVCPFNGEERPKTVLLPSTDEILRMDRKLFLEKFGKTAFARAGLEKIKANIRTINR